MTLYSVQKKESFSRQTMLLKKKRTSHLLKKIFYFFKWPLTQKTTCSHVNNTYETVLHFFLGG